AEEALESSVVDDGCTVTSFVGGGETEAGVADEKQHQALYRRYRPQTPAEVLGQDHVIRALTGSIRENRLHHAFLFCGPRGTGKTSTARILAKMVNCEKGPTAEPCGTCVQCVAIREGQHLDVVEIDAASHGGVEDARELRERAPTAPAMGREKVYIIDEAQRLSREAFDALLKVFEEPPPGVRFVLATTEPHKMPATIVGRCQRFDFRRLTMETLAEHLQSIAASEGAVLTPSAAHAIARQAEGSARDAISLLDQASVMGGSTIDDAAVEALLGAPRGEIQHELADSVAVGDARGMFGIVDRLVQDGQDLRNVTAEALAHFRNLLLVKTAPGQEDLLDIPADGYELLRVQADKFTPGELARVISLLLAAQSDMRWTTSPRLSLELALVRATIPETDPNPAGVVSRLERLERLANLDVGAVVAVDASASPDGPTIPVLGPSGLRSSGSPLTDDAPASSPSVPAPSDTSFDEAAVQTHVQPADAGSIDVAMLRRGWKALMEHLQTTRQPVLRAALESATVATYDGETLELAFPPAKKFTVEKVMSKIDALQTAIADVFGIRPAIVCAVREARDPAGGPSLIEIIDEEEAPSEEEALRRVQEMFGAQVGAEAEPAEKRVAYEGPIQELIDELARLPGIGPKSAQRLAFWLVKAPADDARRLAAAIVQAKERIFFCRECGNVAEGDLCRVCRDESRDRTVLCVVEEPKDAATIEKASLIKGRYHILGGAISPLDGIGPEDLRVQELLDRVERDHVTEVILATNPNLEGNATAMYVAALLKPSGIRVTRLASGLPVGGDLEYADEVTLSQALEGRREM
ncbi:MAG: DNA polymerase III subunit gamma/tau, partial [Actinomycetota bacterium]